MHTYIVYISSAAVNIESVYCF